LRLKLLRKLCDLRGESNAVLSLRVVGGTNGTRSSTAPGLGSGHFMRYDDHFVDQVKGAADIVRVVSEYVRLRKTGSNHTGLCPFHPEKTPSFSVHEGKQFFHCFGCHASGDVFKFVQQMERLTFPEAVKLLAEKFGVPIPEFKSSVEADQSAQERQRLLEINQEAALLFKKNLLSEEGRPALQYLLRRGLTDETIESFDLGVAGQYSDQLLRQLRGRFGVEALLKSGLIQQSERDAGYYDRFRKRIMFPIRNEAGKIVAFGGRIMGDGQPKYLNSPETPVYSKSRILYGFSQARKGIQGKKCAILVEGYMDCIALHQAGLPQAVASCGTSLTEAQARLLRRFTENIVVNFDPDTAGTAATQRSLNIFLEAGFKIRVLMLPGKDDPDEFIKKQGLTAYEKLLEEAPSYFDYLLKQSRQENDITRIEGKVAAVEKILPYLARLSNRIERLEMTRQVSEYFQIEEQNLREELKRAVTQNREKLEFQRPVMAQHPLKPFERIVLRAILENHPTAVELRQRLIESEDYRGLPSESLFRAILTLHQEGRKIEIGTLEERLPESADRNLLNQALFSELNWEQAQNSLEGIRRHRMERDISLLQKKIQEAEKTQDFKLLSALHNRKVELKRQITH
jgi:DNA primase